MKKRKIEGILLVVISVIICFGILEIGLRARQFFLYGTAKVPGWLLADKKGTSVWHPFLRSVPRPSTEWEEVESGNRAVVKINSLGFRSPEIQGKKGENTFRIVCLGGSVAYDTRVSMEDSWAFQLQEKLKEAYSVTNIEVVNAGIPGRTSADSLVNLGLRVIPLEPDVVIIMHGVNDQKPNRYPAFQPDYSHWYRYWCQEKKTCLFMKLFNCLIDKSLLASHIRYRLRFLLNPNLKENWRGEPLKRYDTVSERGLDAYRNNLISMIGMCRLHNIKVIIATVGNSLDENGDWNPGMGTRNPLVFYHECLTLEGIRDGFKQYNRINREVARDYGCRLIDIDRSLPKGKLFFQDDVHFTARGSHKVADIITKGLPWEDWLEEK